MQYSLKIGRRFLSIMAFALLIWSPLASAEDNLLEGMPAGNYPVDLSHASVVWKVSHLGFSTYVGRFTDFSADLVLDSEDFTKSTVAVEIAVESIDTAFPFVEKEDFNKKLSGEWFKSSDHPTITFASTSVSALDGKNFTIQGELTMLGETLPVTLAATLNASTPKHPFLNVPVIGFSATTSIDRTLFGLSNYAPNIGAQVNIEIEGEFAHAADPE